MSRPRLRAIDCDIHASVPSMRALLPYLDDHWRETVEARGIASLESISYPRHAPLTARPDWRDKSGQAATDPATVRAQLLDHFGVRVAICNCLYGVQLVFDAYMAKAFASALNDWIARKWLDPEPRLRASIVAQGCLSSYNNISLAVVKVVEVQYMEDDLSELGRRFAEHLDPIRVRM